MKITKAKAIDFLSEYETNKSDGNVRDRVSHLVNSHLKNNNLSTDSDGNLDYCDLLGWAKCHKNFKGADFPKKPTTYRVMPKGGVKFSGSAVISSKKAIHLPDNLPDAQTKIEQLHETILKLTKEKNQLKEKVENDKPLVAMAIRMKGRNKRNATKKRK